MVNCLHCLISILALTSLGIAQLTNRECVRHVSADNDVARICIRSNRLVQVLGNATDLLLDVSQFSTVSPYAFRRMHLQALKLYHPDPATCTPKEIGLTSSLFKNQKNLKLLTLECIIVPTDASLFQHVRSIDTLFLNRINFANFSYFHLEKFVKLSHLHIQDHKLSSLSSKSLSKFPTNLVNLTIAEPRRVLPGAFSAFGGTLKYLSLENGNLNHAFLSNDSSRIFEGLPYLEILKLGDNKIHIFMDSPFQLLPNLHTVDLTSNQIDVFENNLFDHQKLKVIILNKNKIRRLTPSAFSKAMALQELHLRDNRISAIEPLTFNHPDLLLLDLSWNELGRHLAKATFSNVPNLDVLNLEWNAIQSIDDQTFNHANLSVLDLSYNELTEVPSAAFHRLGRLELLNLNSNQIHTVRAGAFRGCPNVQRLFLAGNSINNIESRAFASLDLNVLDLSSNQIRVISADSFHSLRARILVNLALNNVGVLDPRAFDGSEITAVDLCYVGRAAIDRAISQKVQFLNRQACT